jgi:sporulation protein YlmC with PRC-barrel domain
MKLKYALLSTTAALVLTAAGGIAQAQETTPQGPTHVPNTMPPAASSSTMTPSTSPSMSSSTSSTPSVSTSMATAGTLHEIKNKNTKVSAFNNVSVKTLDAMAVYGSDGKKIGEVDHVLGDSTNTPKAVAVNAGGFLGMGTREVVFPLDKLQKGTDAKKLQTSMTKDEIKALDQWQATHTPKKKTTTNPS